MANQKHGIVVRSNLLHSSLAGSELCCDFHQSQQTEKENMLEKNQFPELHQPIEF
jgi:hypothetical protein